MIEQIETSILENLELESYKNFKNQADSLKNFDLIDFITECTYLLSEEKLDRINNLYELLLEEFRETTGFELCLNYDYEEDGYGGREEYYVFWEVEGDFELSKKGLRDKRAFNKLLKPIIKKDTK